jgi:hypothetical protein
VPSIVSRLTISPLLRSSTVQEQKKADEQKQQGIWARLMKMLYKDLRAGPSGADPSSLLGTAVETEEVRAVVSDLHQCAGIISLMDRCFQTNFMYGWLHTGLCGDSDQDTLI